MSTLMDDINKTGFDVTGEIKTNKDMLRTRNKKYYGQNMRRLESKPIIVEYYQVSVPNSTVGLGTETIAEKIGSNSPLRFRKVYNFPLYGFREFNREANRSETYGVTIDASNESVVLGGTLIPHIGDFLKATVGNTTILFEVTTATPTAMMDNAHYRIGYNYRVANSTDTGKLLTLINEQVIEECICKFDNLGSDLVSIVSLTSAQTVASFAKIYKAMNDRYMGRFYDKITNNLIYREDEDSTVFYSPLVTEFQIRTSSIMYELSGVCCQELLLTHEANDVKNIFMDSVYYDIINEMSNTSQTLDIDLDDFNDLYVTYNKDFYITHRFSSLNYYTDVEIIDNGNKGVPKILDSNHAVVNLIKLVLTDIDNTNTIKLLKKYRVDNSLESYMLTPILLCIVKKHMERLQTV